MSEKWSNCTSMQSVRNVGKGETSRDLRLEILQLQKRLVAAEDIAARHAVMLREGDHRIKNSLQIVASLVDEQARREVGDHARGALLSAATRIRSISVIHDALQSAGGADNVDLGAMLTTMCASLQTMAGSAGFTKVVVQAEALQMSVAIARPLVLAINELVVNALRHAFPDQEDGVVHVRLLHAGDEVSIKVADNGVGLPSDYDAGDGYGTRLVKMMIRQVRGTLLVEHAPGAAFTILLPAKDILAVNALRQA